MAENSKIEWTDHTFNPWMGCTKVSDGCKHCYAETLMDKRYGKVKWGPQGTRVRTSEANWRKPLAWNRQAEREGRRFRVFCASLADVFEAHPQQDLDEWRHDLFMLIQQTPNLDWLLLTKRPENVMPYLQHGWGTDLPDNVWVGTSVENQQQADERIPHLLLVPAAVRFLSMEPLLGPVDLYYVDAGEVIIDVVNGQYGIPDFPLKKCESIDWVIVGGESGHNARPMHPDWARSLRDQCQQAGVPFFFKQWGEWAPTVKMAYENYRNEAKFELNGKVYRYGKKAAGRLLDGVEWNQFPEVVQHG